MDSRGQLPTRTVRLRTQRNLRLVVRPGSDISELRTWLDDDEDRRSSLIASSLDLARSVGSSIGAFISTVEDADSAIDHSVSGVKGPLWGIPIAIKDVIATQFLPTTAQSLVPKPAFCDGSIDAKCVERLRKAGAIIIGKTTTLEFAKGLPERNGPFPLPRNPWNRAHWPGGSSAGSAAAVAAGIVPVALGTDTAGSVRMPASYCGVTGYKPTRGLLSLEGCLRLAPSLDHLGIIARSAEDCLTILSVIAAAPSIPLRIQNSSDIQQMPIRSRLKLGVDWSLIEGSHVSPAVVTAFSAAIKEFEKGGATIQAIDIGADSTITADMRIVTYYENNQVFRGLLNRYLDRFGSSARARLLAGRDTTYDEYVRALARLRECRRSLSLNIHGIDALLMPTTPTVAESIESVYGQSQDRLALTRLWNAFGFPAISCPMGFGENGLPLGLQMIGRPFSDSQLLTTASEYQAVTEWHRAVAPVAY